MINNCTPHILNKYFDHIYVLYISDFELERIQPKLLSKNIQVEYFLGVNGKDTLSQEFIDYSQYHKNIKSRNYLKTVGAFGHLHSFINIIQDAIKFNYNKILILEPDIHFKSNFDNEIERYLSMPYKLLYLGASQHNWTNIDNNYRSIMKSGGYYFADNTYGTFALGIDKIIFNQYLDLLKTKLHPSDVCLNDIQTKYKQECIVAYPNMIICDITKSYTADRWRSQSNVSKKFRWDDYYYDIHDRYTFNLKVNIVYKVTIEVNHIVKNKKATFQICSDNNSITPVIRIPNSIMVEKMVKKYNGSSILCENYIIYITNKLNKIYVNLENIYIDNILFIEFFGLNGADLKHYLPSFKSRFAAPLLSKDPKDQNIKHYYLNLLDGLNSLLKNKI